MLLTARQAADRLGIKLDTLYAYVSRGRLRSVRVPGARARRYRAQDVEALKNRARPPLPGAGSEALMPVIVSAISLIEEGRLYYRGEDAIHLAETATLEEVAALLWREAPHLSPLPASGERERPAPKVREGEGCEDEERLGLIERCQIRLAARAGADLFALDLSRAGVARTGGHILRDLVAVTVGDATPDLPVHRRLAAVWSVGETGADLLRRALVLIADHELNASTFVARCVASTGATPYAVVSAALAALSGRRHGGG
ncbi:MAG: citrate/2-methylcitrate synthase, partial [Stellaceae bacterium]